MATRVVRYFRIMRLSYSPVPLSFLQVVHAAHSLSNRTNSRLMLLLDYNLLYYFRD